MFGSKKNIGGKYKRKKIKKKNIKKTWRKIKNRIKVEKLILFATSNQIIYYNSWFSMKFFVR